MSTLRAHAAVVGCGRILRILTVDAQDQGTKVDVLREFSSAAAFSGGMFDKDLDANRESGVSRILKIVFSARHNIVGYQR
jgi:hypothetical protein